MIENHYISVNRKRCLQVHNQIQTWSLSFIRSAIDTFDSQVVASFSAVHKKDALVKISDMQISSSHVYWEDMQCNGTFINQHTIECQSRMKRLKWRVKSQPKPKKLADKSGSTTCVT
jgi:exo-beta-1,3-glucanase (GH17 family)